MLGHSMGGIVGRAALDVVGDQVDSIVTLSTPHAYPPVTLDGAMDAIYDRLTSLTHPPLVSICGGVSDTDIASDACVVRGSNSLTVFTTAMNGAWSGVEHQAMVWCHQVRWRVAATLLAMSAEPNDKVAVARRFLYGVDTSIHSVRTRAHRLEVTAHTMTLALRMPKAEPHLMVQHCDPQCVAVKPILWASPMPKDPLSPFPLPGEGISPLEQVFVIELNLTSQSGHLEIETHSDAELSWGRHAHSRTSGGVWRESSNMVSSTGVDAITDHEKHVLQHTVAFDNAWASSLAVYRLDLVTNDCRG